MIVHTAAAISQSNSVSFFLFPGSPRLCSHSLLGSSFQLIWPFPLISPEPSRFSSPPAAVSLICLMLCGWTFPEPRQVGSLTFWWPTGWLGSLACSHPHIIQGFPPCIPSVTLLHFSSGAAQRGASVHTAHTRIKSHPVIVTGRLTFSFLPHSLVTARRSPGSCFRSCCLYTATFQVTLFQLIKQTLQLCHPWGIAKTHTIKAVLTVSWR